MALAYFYISETKCIFYSQVFTIDSNKKLVIFIVVCFNLCRVNIHKQLRKSLKFI